MSNMTSRTGVTVRLAPDAHERLRKIAEAEHRSVAGYLELLIEREFTALDDAERVVYLHVAPEVADEPQGEIQREAGESEERYNRRRSALIALFGES